MHSNTLYMYMDAIWNVMKQENSNQFVFLLLPFVSLFFLLSAKF